MVVMWTKIGDEFVDDAADRSDAAVRTHVEALGWSNRRLLDLRIPKRDLRRFAFSEHADDAVTELLNCGWWVDDGDAWQIVYRPEWQQSREQVEHRRTQNAQAQERGRRHRAGDHSLCLPERCVSARVSSADKDADSPADPGRVGSVRDGSNYSPTEVENARENCAECQRRRGFGSGPCPEHQVTS